MLEGGKARIDRFAMAAGLALDESAGAVNFDELVLTRPSSAMEAVNILGDDYLHFAGLLKAHDGLVYDVGLGIAVFLPEFQLVFPVLDARGFLGHKILIINRLACGPDASGTAKGRDATGGGDASAGEDKDTLGVPKIIGESSRHGRRVASRERFG